MLELMAESLQILDSHLIKYENVVLACRTIAYDPGAQLVFVICCPCLETMMMKIMTNVLLSSEET